MNYLISKHPEFFDKIGKYNFCELEDMVLPETIALDTETTGLTPRNCDIFCVQIGTGSDNYIIHMYDGNYNFEDIVPFITDKVLIGHNILFDLGFMYKYNFWPKEVKDTMLASKVLYNGYTESTRGKNGAIADVPYRSDFGTVMERELGVKYDKTEQKNIHLVKLSQPSTIEYSFNDVDRLLELHDALEKKIVAQGFEETYKLHCRYIKALAYIEQCGLPISTNKWREKMEEDLVNQLKWKAKIEEYIYDNLPQFADGQIDMFDEKKRITVSITSSTQMIKVFKAFKINTINKEGKDSIKEEVIAKSNHEFVKLWLDFQEANQRVTTFGDNILQKVVNDRIYTNFNPMVDTARLSTRKGGINFLNFPADEITRHCFVANPGNVMIVCDYSGQETVIAADLSGDKAMTNSVLTGACLHSAFARILFPEIAHLSDAVIQKEHKDKRQAAKAPRFAFQYGGSAFTIHQKEGIELERAYEIENAFKLLHEGLYTWGAKEFDKAIKQGYIESADGWKLKLPRFEQFKEFKQKIESITKDQWQWYKHGKAEFKKKEEDDKYVIINQRNVDFYASRKREVSTFFKLKSEYQRLCLNNPVQARGAHQLKYATCLMFEWIIDNNLQWKVLIPNTVHDEIILECKDEYKDIAKQALEESMLEGGNRYLTNLKIKADANYGPSWGEAK